MKMTKTAAAKPTAAKTAARHRAAAKMKARKQVRG